MKKIRSILVSTYHKAKYALNRRKRHSVRIADSWQSVDEIINDRLSLGRYGDGEFSMVRAYLDKGGNVDYGFQTYNDKMGQRLYQILSEGGSDRANFKIGLPGCMFGIGAGYLNPKAGNFWRGYSNGNLSWLLKVIPEGKTYLDSTFSRFYLSHRDKSRCREYIGHVKDIWRNRDLIIVEGERTCLGVGNDLFAEAKSVKRILCPATNAWGRYSEILETTLKNTPPSR